MGSVNRRAGIPGLVLALFLVFPSVVFARGTSTGSDAPAATLSALFPRSPAIASRISFWTRIFTEYSEDQIVVHDARYIDKVYAVLDVGSASKKQINALNEVERTRISNVLLRLHKHGDNPAGLSPEERKIYELWQDVDEVDKFTAAADRIHFQSGLRNRFATGIRVSRRHLAQMESIFHDEGIPVELTRLPLIESCFELRAYSYKGAAGIWQFMPATGRVHGLRVDTLIDERRDPILATRAAARYLEGSYRRLDSWPLAITAYNHGVGGIARAVRETGSSDIADLIERYRGPAFGFAGQNFYAEFLAALDVDSHPERYFGEVTFEEPQPTELIPMPRSIGLTTAARAAGVSREELAALNPSLGRRIVMSGADVPRGYKLRFPADSKADFEDQPAPALAAAETDRPASVGTHSVEPGETLSHIAESSGTSVSALAQHNGIHDARGLRAGQVIKVPSRDQAGIITASVQPSKADPDKRQLGSQRGGSTSSVETADAIRHRVSRGQTLSHIAKKYGTSVSTLKRHNGIGNVRQLRTGQVIKVPGGGGGQVVASVSPSQTDRYVRHRVSRGQTLSHIAKKYGTSVSTLKRQNGIRDARRLRERQVIRIPTG